MLKYKVLFAGFLGVLLIISCTREDNDLGLSVYNGNVLNVNVGEVTPLFSYYTLRDSVTTDERSKVLLGSYNDPVFGLIKADFASQFILNSYNPNFGHNPQTDSIFLMMKCVGYYGTDTSVAQTYKVYRLNAPLNKDTAYYANTDISDFVDLSSPIAEYTTSFNPNSGYLKIPLPSSLGDELLADTAYNSNEDFLSTFYGLFVTTEEVTGDGAVYYFSPLAEDGIIIDMYFHNDSLDSLNYKYYSSQKAAYFTRYKHDYTGTDVETNMNDTGSTYLYVQSGAGAVGVVDLSSLNMWKDSGNLGINKAELIFEVDTSLCGALDPPERLLLEIVDDNNEFNAPLDYFLSNVYFDGYYNKEAGIYKFTITQYVQQLLKESSQNTKLYVFPQSNKVSVRRVVLKNNPKLKLVYTKF